MVEIIGVVVQHNQRIEVPDSETRPYTEIEWWGTTEPQASTIPGIHGRLGEFVRMTIESISADAAVQISRRERGTSTTIGSEG